MTTAILMAERDALLAALTAKDAEGFYRVPNGPDADKMVARARELNEAIALELLKERAA